jgi:hypothetical protein
MRHWPRVNPVSWAGFRGRAARLVMAWTVWLSQIFFALRGAQTMDDLEDLDGVPEG